MSDTGIYTAMREHSKMVSAKNLEYNTAQIKSAGLAFSSHNNDLHLIIRHAGKVVDYWPSSGRYSIRGGVRDRGTKRLLHTLGICPECKCGLIRGQCPDTSCCGPS